MKDLKNSNLPKAFEMINKVNDRFSEIRRKKLIYLKVILVKMN